MPTINRLKKLPKPERKEIEPTEQKLLRRKFYNSTKWQKLREDFIKLHPLCEQCLSEGKVTAADQVHHKRSPFDYKAGTINWELGLDPDNLESICAECHGKRHAEEHGYVDPQIILNNLDKLLNNND